MRSGVGFDRQDASREPAPPVEPCGLPSVRTNIDEHFDTGLSGRPPLASCWREPVVPDRNVTHY